MIDQLLVDQLLIDWLIDRLIETSIQSIGWSIDYWLIGRSNVIIFGQQQVGSLLFEIRLVDLEFSKFLQQGLWLAELKTYNNYHPWEEIFCFFLSYLMKLYKSLKGGCTRFKVEHT